LSGPGTATLDARLVLPDRPFDPEAWRRLGAATLRGAHLRTSMLDIGPGVLSRFGVVSPLEGKVEIAADVAEGISGATFHVDLSKVRGGLLRRPIAARIDGGIDGNETHILATVREDTTTLVTVRARIPMSLTALAHDAHAFTTAPLEASATIDAVPAR